MSHLRHVADGRSGFASTSTARITPRRLWRQTSSVGGTSASMAPTRARSRLAHATSSEKSPRCKHQRGLPRRHPFPRCARRRCREMHRKLLRTRTCTGRVRRRSHGHAGRGGRTQPLALTTELRGSAGVGRLLADPRAGAARGLHGRGRPRALGLAARGPCRPRHARHGRGFLVPPPPVPAPAPTPPPRLQPPTV